MEAEELLKIKNYILEFILDKGPGLVMAIVTLVVGFWVISKLTRITRKTMKKRNVDESLIPFMTSLVNISLKVLLIISVAGMIGIATTSFVAVLGAAGLAIGLALQGSLANFAGGVLILIFKPFKVGDLIVTQGITGTVKSITIFNTIITTPRGNTAIIPNGQVANDKLVNYAKEPVSRVDLIVGIAYSENIPRAKEVILNTMKANEKVLDDPAPFVGVFELADSSVNLAVRPHCKQEHYWDVYFEIQEEVKMALDEAKIEIPFPQRDIHVKSNSPID